MKNPTSSSITVRALAGMAIVCGVFAAPCVFAQGTVPFPPAGSGETHLNNGGTDVYVLENATLNYNNKSINVGSGGSTNNMALIGTGGVISNISNLRIGYLAGANFNTMTISGAGADVRTNSFINVGNVGNNNKLYIGDGAYVYGGRRVTVGQEAGSDNNQVIITGQGSEFRIMDTIRIGQIGNNNLVEVLDGGKLVTLNQDGAASIDVGQNAGVYGNMLVVSGVGSTVEGAGGLSIGARANATTSQYAYQNSVVISDGGKISLGSSMATGLLISTASGAHTNTLTISSGGSLELVQGDIYVGNNVASSNAIIMHSGGRIDGVGMTVRGGAALSLGGAQTTVELSSDATFGGTNTATVASLSVYDTAVLRVGGNLTLNKNLAMTWEVNPDAPIIEANKLIFGVATGQEVQTLLLWLSDITAVGDFLIAATTLGIEGFDQWYANATITLDGLTDGLYYNGLFVQGNDLYVRITNVPEPAFTAGAFILLVAVLVRRRR